MVIWWNGETYESDLGDCTDLEFAPNDIPDSDFCGLELESMCRIHGEPMEKRVAFDGINTGRRFYCCRINDVKCGFMWKDPEWHDPMKRALTSLWGQYESEIENFAEEHMKVEDKYTNLIADVQKWIAATEKMVISTNYHQIKEGGEADGCHNLSLLDVLNETAKKDLLEMAEENNKIDFEMAEENNEENVRRKKSHGKECVENNTKL